MRIVVRTLSRGKCRRREALLALVLICIEEPLERTNRAPHPKLPFICKTNLVPRHSLLNLSFQERMFMELFFIGGRNRVL